MFRATAAVVRDMLLFYTRFVILTIIVAFACDELNSGGNLLAQFKLQRQTRAMFVNEPIHSVNKTQCW